MTIPVYPETKGRLERTKGSDRRGSPTINLLLGAALRRFRALGGGSRRQPILTIVPKKHVEPLAKELEAPIFMPLDVNTEGQLEQVFRADREGMGPARFPASFHRVFRRRRPCTGGVVDVDHDGFSQDHGRVLLVIHAHGPFGRAADEEWRLRFSP